MLGEADEGQPLGFRVAYEACVAGLSIKGEELARVFQVLQADVAERRRREENRCSALYRRLVLPLTSRDVTQDDGRRFCERRRACLHCFLCLLKERA